MALEPIIFERVCTDTSHLELHTDIPCTISGLEIVGGKLVAAFVGDPVKAAKLTKKTIWQPGVTLCVTVEPEKPGGSIGVAVGREPVGREPVETDKKSDKPAKK